MKLTFALEISLVLCIGVMTKVEGAELRLFKDSHPEDWGVIYDTHKDTTSTHIENGINLRDQCHWVKHTRICWNDRANAAYAVEGAWALYEHANNQGHLIATLCPGEKIYDFGNWENKVSSVKLLSVPEECTNGYLIIYSKDNFKGHRAVITSDVLDLKQQPHEEDSNSRFDNDIDSVQAIAGSWKLYKDTYHEEEGLIATLCPGENKYEFNYMGNKVSSVKKLDYVPEECTNGKLIIYSKDNFEGRRAVITSDVPDLEHQPHEQNSNSEFDKDINSVQAIAGYWMLYKEKDFKGSGLCIQEKQEPKKIQADYKDKVNSIKKVDSC